MGDVGPTRNSSSIPITAISPAEGYRRERPFTQAGANVFRHCKIQKLRGRIVTRISDNTFSKLRIARAYTKLLCIPDGETKLVSLGLIGNYEVRMLEAARADSDYGQLFLLELFDHDSQLAVESRVCGDIEQGVAAFENFVSR
jgi:hypothetical protein